MRWMIIPLAVGQIKSIYTFYQLRVGIKMNSKARTLAGRKMEYCTIGRKTFEHL